MTTTTPASPQAGSSGSSAAAARARLQRLLRGETADPGWARPALLGLLLVTAVLYLWNLSASGYGNSFYAAAAQAGSVSWKALFFGSFDASSFITVDKPPASLWLMGISGHIFGFNSWSMLVPQALEGVASVGLLYAAVKRWHGPAAGLVAGAVLMLTPSAALMFKFNNPDALLVLLLVAGSYCMVRAVESGRTQWLLLAGSCVGFGFLTKMLQAFLVVPAFGLMYLVCAPTSFGRRLLQLIAGLGAMVVSAGWWVAIVELLPASSRPYVGGSTNDSILGLAFGYNGFGRILGGAGNGGGGGGGGGRGGGGGSFGGATGLTRLFSSEMGNEISWLLPAALIALVAGLIITRRAPRTDRLRASLILWGGSMLVTGLTFSYMKGTIHPYYTIALAPSVAALVAVGGGALWQRRDDRRARAGLAVMIAATAVWSFVLLHRNAGWHPELRYAIAVVGAVAAVGLVVPVVALARVLGGLTLAGLIAGLAGTTAYAVTTAGSAHTGSIPSVGPAGASSGGGFGGGGGGFGGRRGAGQGGTPPNGTSPGNGFPTGGGNGGGFGGGGAGGGADGGSTNTALVALLKATTTKWAAATSGSMSAAPLQLASRKPVMSMGGFSGSDPTPTLAAFQADVKAGQIGYYISGGGFGGGGQGGGGQGGGQGGGGRGGNNQIATWVAANYTATTVGGTTVYDLRPK
jgi:4-amino-4-deoxy-L-arabinose transferase-like glycosyltransferase